VTDEEKQKADAAQEYYRTAYDGIQKNKAENPPLVDYDLPLTEPDSEKEWIFPGHSHTHHCMEQVISTRKKADAHTDPKEAAKLHIIATELEKKAHKRVLFRQHHYVDWRGKRRVFYTLIHRFGFQTDVFHTHAKALWTEQEAKDFHAERMAHPGWNAPKSSLTEFHRSQKKQHISVEDEAKIAEIRNQIPKVK
jgi:hypothetical protein